MTFSNIWSIKFSGFHCAANRQRIVKRQNKRALGIEKLEHRELLSAATQKMVINGDAEIANVRKVTVTFTDIGADPQSVRFGFNNWNLGAPQTYSPNMEVTIPNYVGTNWVNAAVTLANGETTSVYDSIRYVNPGLRINNNVDRTNLREVTATFDNVSPDVVGVRFAYNGSSYGAQVPFSSNMTVTLPNFEGQNFVNAQIVYANQQTRTVWDSIEYKRASVAIDDGAETTYDRQVRVSFKDVSSDAQTVSFAFNGGAYGDPVAFASQLDVTLPNWDGVSYVNSKVRFATGREAWLWDSIDYMPDNDGDGLYNRWETNGIDVNADGTIDLQLPGADPNRKDLYVEIDSMVGRAPSALAIPVPGLEAELSTNTILDGVVESFKQHGIHLHLQIDERDIPLANFPNAFAEFDAIKANRWGTPAERAATNAAATLDAKRLAYRYAMFANTHSNGGSSGFGELPGNDFTITLGSWSVPGGTPAEQAGTFMHELGHNLNLDHGGGDEINYKPNYHSVMNYLWQVPGYNNDQEDWRLDYSSEQLPTLDERNLTESAGIGFAEHSIHGQHSVRLCDIQISGECGSSVPEHGPVDFNGDGDSTDIGLIRNLNGDQNLSELHGYHDWANLRLPILKSANFADGVHTFVSHESHPWHAPVESAHILSAHNEEGSKLAAAWSTPRPISQVNSPIRKHRFDVVRRAEVALTLANQHERENGRMANQLSTPAVSSTDRIFGELSAFDNFSSELDTAGQVIGLGQSFGLRHELPQFRP